MIRDLLEDDAGDSTAHAIAEEAGQIFGFSGRTIRDWATEFAKEETFGLDLRGKTSPTHLLDDEDLKRRVTSFLAEKAHALGGEVLTVLKFHQFVNDTLLKDLADDPGNPYQMAIKDVEGDRIVRSVPRPEIVGKYYEMNGGIDVHNKMRQGDLALEKHWVTQDPYFRIFTTLIGICVTDAFNMMKYRIGDHRSDPRRHWSLREFAGVLAHQLLNNKWEEPQNASRRQPNSSEVDALLETQEGADDLDQMRFLQHRLERVPGTRPNGGGKQIRCHVCGAHTSWYCVAPGCVGRKGGAYCGICPGTSSRDCFDVHRGIVRETPAHTEARRPLGRLGLSVSSGGSVRALTFSAGSV